MKIAVAGAGYVGLSISVLLAQHHTVRTVDPLPEKVEAINARRSPIADAEIEDYLAHRALDLQATADAAAAYTGAELIVVATPTNYDSEKNYFDTSSVEAVLALARRYAPDAVVVSSGSLVKLPIKKTLFILFHLLRFFLCYAILTMFCLMTSASMPQTRTSSAQTSPSPSKVISA